MNLDFRTLRVFYENDFCLNIFNNTISVRLLVFCTKTQHWMLCIKTRFLMLCIKNKTSYVFSSDGSRS